MTDTVEWHLAQLREATDQETLKERWRRASLAFHPDRRPGDPEATATFTKLSHAYRARVQTLTRGPCHVCEGTGKEVVESKGFYQLHRTCRRCGGAGKLAH